MNERPAAGDLPAGTPVRFRAAAAYLPEVRSLLAELDPSTELVGTVLGYSDHGRRPRGFVLVALPGDVMVVVPRGDLHELVEPAVQMLRA